MKLFKKYSKFILLFSFLLIWNLIIQPLYLDEIWNYGFAHSIYQGLVPYKDFNLVITPFFPFIVSLFFQLFGSNMLIFHIFNALLLTIFFAFVKNLIKENSYIILLCCCMVLSVTFPSYNFFLLFLLVLLIYLEKNKGNDYLIGLILACAILTKQTVGIFLLLPSLIYFKDKGKIVKRYGVVLGTMFVFLIYLFFSKSLTQFIDLCFLGLIDFGSKNATGINIYFILSLVMVIITFVFIKKSDKQEKIYNYYLLAFYSVLIPIFDIYHFKIFYLAFLIIFFLQQKIKIKLNIKLFVVGILICISCILLYWKCKSGVVYPNQINRFEYRLIDKKHSKFTNLINKKIKKYTSENKKIIFLSADGYYFKVINNMKIDYLDLINDGNWGYNGNNKLLNTIKKNKNAVFFVDIEEYGPSRQTNQKALKYVLKYGKKIDSMENYKIYTLGVIKYEKN